MQGVFSSSFATTVIDNFWKHGLPSAIGWNIVCQRYRILLLLFLFTYKSLDQRFVIISIILHDNKKKISPVIQNSWVRTFKGTSAQSFHITIDTLKAMHFSPGTIMYSLFILMVDISSGSSRSDCSELDLRTMHGAQHNHRARRMCIRWP